MLVVLVPGFTFYVRFSRRAPENKLDLTNEKSTVKQLFCNSRLVPFSIAQHNDEQFRYIIIASTGIMATFSMRQLLKLGNLLFLLVSILLLENEVTRAETAEMTCEADGTCASSDNTGPAIEESVPAGQEFPVELVNESKHRVDVYWDDGKKGKKVTTIEQNGKGRLRTFRDHSFFFTRHGVHEALFDPETDTKHRFTAARPGEIFVIPKSAAPSENMCQDRFSICEQYAKNGGCWRGPGWMIVHCCKTCDKDLGSSKLIDSSVRCTKEFLNITESAWKPGDLNKLFTSWATDKKFTEYEPVVHSSPDGAHGGQSGPWVITFDNFFTSEEADALISGGRLEGFERSTNQGAVNALGETQRVVSKTRTSSNAWCRGKCEKLPEVQAVTKRIEEVTGIPQKNYESFQILEYEPNQFYRSHHDNTGRTTKPAGPRIMTFFLYLSDVEEGGETYFNKLKFGVKPKKGRALIWPSVTDDDPEFWDDRMYHEAKDVIKGKKYAANHWIHMNDFMGPNDWGCTGSFS